MLHTLGANALCRKHGIHIASVYKALKQLFAKVATTFERKKKTSPNHCELRGIPPLLRLGFNVNHAKLVRRKPDLVSQNQ